MDYVAGRNRYMGYLISLGIYSFKGVKVGLDCANGASWNIAKSVFDALGDTGRILVRESGTEPVVRVMMEAPDHDTCQKYVDEVVNVICEKGYKA